jgi:general secretion pathway protein L
LGFSTKNNNKAMSFTAKFQTFMRWWGEGLYNGLPNPARKLFRTELPRLLLQVQDERTLEAAWLQDGKKQTCGRINLQDTDTSLSNLLPKHAQRKPYQVELCLGKAQVLALQHYFPEAVKDNLQQVLSYQLDRLTPFTADNALFDARVAQHDKGRKEILADIVVVPKLVVERLSRQLSELGIGLIQIVSVAGAHPDINLLAKQSGATTQQWSRVPLYFFLGALALSLAIPLGYKYRRVDQIDTALAEVRKSSAEQLSIREKLVEAEDALKFIEDKRNTMPMALDVVEKLSALIPDHTWLERLGIQGGKLEIRGESAKALTLIDSLEEAPEFADVRFKSPVTRNKDNGRDRFHIEASLEVSNAE